MTRGPGRMRNLVADLMRLPRAGQNVSVRLRVRVERDRERWIRTFDAQRLETVQWQQGSLLIEAAGPLRFGFRLMCDATGMQFASARCWFLGFPLPAALAPRVQATLVG